MKRMHMDTSIRKGSANSPAPKSLIMKGVAPQDSVDPWCSTQKEKKKFTIPWKSLAKWSFIMYTLFIVYNLMKDGGML